jgi:hypothetical protein
MNDVQALPLEKRKWHYLQPPAAFEVAPCSCGNHETQWSEFAKHIWCAKCEKDFIPVHAGIFDGPIGVKVAAMMGVRFDRLNIETNRVERFDLDTLKYVVEGQPVAAEGVLGSALPAP